MNRIQLILVTAVILLLAFALGWFTYWLMHRFSRMAGGDIAEMDLLAQSLHAAEEARDQAILYLEQREAELMDQIAQTEARLSAALENLQDARREVDNLSDQFARIKVQN